MGEMRTRLNIGLKDPNRPVEEQERTIESAKMGNNSIVPTDLVFSILIELDQSDEPAWAYLDYQHAHIRDVIRNTYAKAQDAVKGLLIRLIWDGSQR